MLRRTVLVTAAIVFAVSASCSRGVERPVTGDAPTSPTAVAGNPSSMQTGLDTGALFGPLGVPMPPRNEAVLFRRALETSYETVLRRSATNGTYVDLEGDVIWQMEYIRYRVSGCSHGEAVQRVMAQIDGNPPGPDCGLTPEGEVQFPGRQDTVAFRRGLDDKYFQMGRPLGFSTVDIEGSGVWTQEYLRYRTNACDHTTGQQKTLDQLTGNPPSPVCYVPPSCVYAFASTNFVSLSPSAGTYTHEVLKVSGLSDCTWTASVDNPFITITSGTSGGDRGIITYTVPANLGAERTGRIRLATTGGGGASLQVTQRARTFDVSIQMFDYKESTAATNTCLIKLFGGGNTSCTFIATSRLPEATTRYQWFATWNYYNGVTRTSQLDGVSNTFVINESCNALATNNGDTVDVTVTLTAFDSAGNQQTVVSGQGLQQAFFLKIFPCQ